jgi:hypothetical protein
MAIIKTVTVGLSYTYNLGDYSNVRPSIEFTAEVKEGENIEVVRAALAEDCRLHVHGEIDAALERIDKPPAFYEGPRFKLLAMKEVKMAAIVPDEIRNFPGAWDTVGAYYYERPYDKVQTYARKKYPDYTLIDCSNGDLEALPPVERFTVIEMYYDDKLCYIILGDKELSRSHLDGGWRYGARETMRNSLLGNIVADLQAQALEKGAEFIDVTNGDLSKLPPAPESQEIEIPFEDEPDEDDQDYEPDDEDDYEDSDQ